MLLACKKFRSLHWLPVKAWTRYKVPAVQFSSEKPIGTLRRLSDVSPIVFKTALGTGPQYVSDFLVLLLLSIKRTVLLLGYTKRS